MKTSSTIRQNLRTVAFSFCGALFLWSAPLCRADQEPASVEVALATPVTFSLGEPIMLHYKLSNLSSDTNLAVLSGIYNTSWYTLGLTDAKGLPVRLIPDTRPLDPPGFHAGDVSVFAIGDKRDSWQDGYIVASKSFVVPRPGEYVLTLHINAAYAQVAPTLEDPTAMKSMMKSSGTTLVRDFHFPLTITAANPDVLQAKAAALQEAIDKEPISTLLLPEMDELFSMPEAQAAAVWEKMALQAKPMNRELIAGKLAELSSAKTADILFKMADNPASGSGFVGDKLAEVYNHGSPALRQHIKSVAMQKGIQLPEQIVIPRVID